MPQRVSEADRRARKIQYEFSLAPAVKAPEPLKPRGIKTPKTEKVLAEAARRYNFTSDQLRIIMDTFGSENYEKVAQAVSGMIESQHLTFEAALNTIEFI